MTGKRWFRRLGITFLLVIVGVVLLLATYAYWLPWACCWLPVRPLAMSRSRQRWPTARTCANKALGAGRQAKMDTLFSEVNDSFKAYGVAGHRHLPEIEQGLADIAGGDVRVTFVPHLLPINRGIHATLYATLLDGDVDLQALYEQRFADEPAAAGVRWGSPTAP